MIMITFYSQTEHCGYKCSDYFQQLPKEGSAKVYSEEPRGQLVIAGNDDARQLEIYNPAPVGKEGEIQVTVTGETKPTKTYRSYRKAPKKAKQVNFSDFKRTDPVLSSFDKLDEPYVPQNECPLTNIAEDIGFE